VSEQTALELRGEQRSVQPSVQNDQNILAVIARAAADPSVDVNKMQSLLEMQRTIMKDMAEREFNAAMSRLQTKLPQVQKRGAVMVSGAVRSRYALLEDVDRAIRTPMAEEGFALNFGLSPGQGAITVVVELRHSAGHMKSESLSIPIDSSGSKNPVQAIGSTIAYARRYLTCLILNIVITDEDSDGQTAEPITSDQLNKILDLIEASGAKESALLKWLGVDRLEHIRQQDFPRVIAGLEQKLAGKK
jgi:hypothetical protein